MAVVGVVVFVGLGDALQDEAAVAHGVACAVVGDGLEVQGDVGRLAAHLHVAVTVAQVKIGVELDGLLAAQEEVLIDAVVAAVHGCLHHLGPASVEASVKENAIKMSFHIERPLCAIVAEEQHAQLIGQASEVDFAKRQTVIGDQVVELLGVILADGFPPGDGLLAVSPPSFHAHLGQGDAWRVGCCLSVRCRAVLLACGRMVGLIPGVFPRKDEVE